MAATVVATAAGAAHSASVACTEPVASMRGMVRLAPRAALTPKLVEKSPDQTPARPARCVRMSCGVSTLSPQMPSPASTVPANIVVVLMGRSASETVSRVVSARAAPCSPRCRSSTGARGAPRASMSTGRLESVAALTGVRSNVSLMGASAAETLVIGSRRFSPISRMRAAAMRPSRRSGRDVIQRLL